MAARLPVSVRRGVSYMYNKKLRYREEHSASVAVKSEYEMLQHVLKHSGK